MVAHKKLLACPSHTRSIHTLEQNFLSFQLARKEVSPICLLQQAVDDTESEKVQVKTERHRDGESQGKVSVIKGNTREHKAHISSPLKLSTFFFLASISHLFRTHHKAILPQNPVHR